MTRTTVVAVHAWEALDSRGRPTVACRVTLEGGGSGRAVVPSGASTGGHEAHELRDGGIRYAGFGVRNAVDNANGTLADRVIGMDADDSDAIDRALEAADNDLALGNVGANAVLAISLAVTLAVADETRRPLWRSVGGDGSPLLPLPMVNIISGGAHARGALDIQDILAVPVGASSFTESMEWVARVRAAAAVIMESRGITTSLVADEGGLAGGLETNEQALALVAEAISASGLRPGQDVSIAIDFAANQMWDGSGYRLALENRTVTGEEWLALIATWCNRYPVVSIEDVLHEDDWSGWTAAQAELGDQCQLLGDDHFATNLERVERGIREQSANAVLIKPNQAGTVSRAAAVTKAAQAAGLSTVVSARSGDTEDSWLADFAVGWRSGQIKVGSTMRSERTAKWNRLLEIESEMGKSIEFASRGVIAGA